MPVTVGQITGQTAKATFTVTIKGEDEDGQEYTSQEHVSIKYYPGRITEKTIALARAIDREDLEAVLGSFHAYNEELVRLVKWWDVMENDGETMFPLDAKRLEELSWEFRSQLLTVMVEEQSPNQVSPQMNGVH